MNSILILEYNSERLGFIFQKNSQEIYTKWMFRLNTFTSEKVPDGKSCRWKIQLVEKTASILKDDWIEDDLTRNGSIRGLLRSEEIRFY